MRFMLEPSCGCKSRYSLPGVDRVPVKYVWCPNHGWKPIASTTATSDQAAQVAFTGSTPKEADRG